MSKLILVTGGLGYIGSHTVVSLQESGYDVFIVDNLSNSSLDVLDRIESITGIRPRFSLTDSRDRVKVNQLFKTYQFDGMIHFAASKSVSESVKNPYLYYENNVGSFLNIVNRKLPLIFSSSCTVYGQSDELPIKETSPFKVAESPYGNTKQVCEEIIRDICKSDKSRSIVSLRYFNPIGAHESSLIGESPNGVPQNLVPYLTQVAKGLESELLVYGDDYPTPDGTCIRDYIHVMDLAEAHVKALKYCMEGNSNVFNVGTGKGTSVKEVINSFVSSTGRALPYRVVDRRPGDIISAYADTEKIEKVLGWKSRRSLEDALLSAWNWRVRN